MIRARWRFRPAATALRLALAAQAVQAAAPTAALNLPAAQVQRLKDEGRQIKKVRTFEDVTVDVVSQALKDQYIKNAADKQAGAAKYRADLQALADSGALGRYEDGSPLKLRDVERALTREYGRRMAKPGAASGVNLLLSLAETSGAETLNLVESTFLSRLAAFLHGLFMVSSWSLQGLFRVSSVSLQGLFSVSSGSLQGLFRVSSGSL